MAGVREEVRQQLEASAEQGGLLDGSVPDASQLVVVQFEATPPFRIEMVYASGGCDGGACRALHAALTSQKLTALLAERQAAFDAQLDDTFGLMKATLGGAPLTKPTRAFAAATLSALVGNLGYFYGTLVVAGADGKPNTRTAAAPLFTGVPSCSFFPRGFLWDEGFHQLLLGARPPSRPPVAAYRLV